VNILCTLFPHSFKEIKDMQSFHVFSTLFVFSTAVGFFRSWGWPRRLRMPYGANLKIWSCLLALRLEIALSRPDASFVLRPLICLAGLDFPIVDQQSLGCVISVCVCVSVSLTGLSMPVDHFCLTGGRAMSDRGHNQTGSKGHARPSHPNAFTSLDSKH